MFTLANVSVAKRLVLIAGSAILSIVAMTVVGLVSERQLILEERQSSVQQTVEIAHGVAVHFHDQVVKGEISAEEGKLRAAAAIRALRYGGSEYFWINDMNQKMVMHPVKPELEGRDLTENKDPSGKRLFVEFVATVKNSGSGFVFYGWPKPGSSEPVPKVSFVKGFEPWGWVIGSGVYIDTVDAAIAVRAAEFAGATAILLVILFTISLLTGRSMLRQLGGEPAYATEVSRRIAAGDLSIDIALRNDDKSSMLSAIKTMRDGLAGIVERVRAGSESVAAASAQIAQGNQDLSSRTEEQASALEQTAASMEQLSSTVKQNADNAHQANQLAQSASSVAIEGGQGRGFAVVASEVRSLAQRSAAAAKEIKALIDTSVERVGQGSALVDKAGATMTEVVSSIQRVTDIMGEISAASVEQSAGVAQVGEAVSQMDKTTQQNAALAEESAAAAGSLKNQARQLVEVVAVFKLGLRAAGSGHAADMSAPRSAAALPAALERPAPMRAAKLLRLRQDPAARRHAGALLAAAPMAAKLAPAGNADWESF